MPSLSRERERRLKTREGEAEMEESQKAQPIKIIRERRGGVPKELVERSRRQAKTHKLLTAALKEGPKTVPEVAEATAMPSHEVLWKLMGMKKYGLVVEGEERDGYYQYALKNE
jgi:predicted Rossmann fold nucleotide-binding protein DprA/Smf involved in DNA uptake